MKYFQLEDTLYAYDVDNYRYFKVKISKLGTYYLSSTINPVRLEIYQNGSKIFDFRVFF